MKLPQELVEGLLDAPDTQIDHSLFEDIKSWDLNPSASDLLAILDKMVYGALASEFSINVFEALLNQAMAEEGITLEELRENNAT